MRIAGNTLLITGANRGIGRALVDEALKRNAKKIYAGTRQPLAIADERVTALNLDVTDAGQIKRAVENVSALDILINNAGLALYDQLTDKEVVERQLAVNLYGSAAVSHAFLPLLARSRGTVVNVLSVAAFAAIPSIPGYSVSKAAALSMTMSLRALFASREVTVQAAFPGPVDTDMSRGFDVPKASPDSVASAILDGVENGDEDIFPDPMSESMAENWRSSAAKALERTFAGLVGAVQN